jgi:hypothetical protein
MSLVPFSNQLDDFASGRPDDFDGSVTDYYLYPYKGKESESGKYYLFLNLSFEPDSDSGFDPFEEQYFMGNLFSAAPSRDNKKPSGGTEEFYRELGNGTESIPEGKEESYRGKYLLGKPGKGTSYEMICNKMRDLGFDFTGTKAGDLSFLLMKGHFNRLPQDNLPASAKKEQRERRVLVPTDLAKGSAKAKSSSKPAAASNDADDNESTSDDIGERVKAIILEALEAESPLPITSFNALVKKKFSDTVERTEAMSWIADRDPKNKKRRVNFIDIPGTIYDMEEDTIELG